MRRMSKKSALGRFAIGWILTGTLLAGQPQAAQRPNIVVILCDDMGFSDIGAYGGEISTPNLDRLASEGIRFTQFYNNAKCTQTRAALLTGLYHHQSNDLRIPNHVTVAEVLGTADYTTLMSGKWHLGNYAGSNEAKWTVSDQPTRRGFERYFGFLTGAINFFTGLDYGTGQQVMVLNEKPYQAPANFYSTDTFTDYATEFLREAAKKDQPFFLYLAYNAPHYPLQARPEDIELYRGKYMEGWDKIRGRRYQKLIELGLIKPGWPLTARDEIVPDWDSLGEAEKREEDHLMAVFAAMVHRLDRNIGRVLDTLDELKEADSTLVIFLSDNGGCPWAANLTPNTPPGPAESGRTYDTEWANVSNTPFRSYKQYSHEGGVSTPFIARFPGKIRPGSMTTDIAHLIDLFPTFVELAGAQYPDQFKGNRILPLEGRSLVPAFQGKGRPEAPYYWEYASNHAVRLGRWKLVAERSRDWELYDMEVDRSELNDLAAQQPARVAEMARMYEEWARRTGANTHAECKQAAVSGQVCYLDPQTRKQLNRAEAQALRNSKKQP